jgi:hypothetical protein
LSPLNGNHPVRLRLPLLHRRGISKGPDDRRGMNAPSCIGTDWTDPKRKSEQPRKLGVRAALTTFARLLQLTQSIRSIRLQLNRVRDPIPSQKHEFRNFVANADRQLLLEARVSEPPHRSSWPGLLWSRTGPGRQLPARQDRRRDKTPVVTDANPPHPVPGHLAVPRCVGRCMRISGQRDHRFQSKEITGSDCHFQKHAPTWRSLRAWP